MKIVAQLPFEFEPRKIFNKPIGIILFSLGSSCRVEQQDDDLSTCCLSEFYFTPGSPSFQFCSI